MENLSNDFRSCDANARDYSREKEKTIGPHRNKKYFRLHLHNKTMLAYSVHIPSQNVNKTIPKLTMKNCQKQQQQHQSKIE